MWDGQQAATCKPSPPRLLASGREELQRAQPIGPFLCNSNSRLKRQQGLGG